MGSGDDMNDLGLSSADSSFLLEFTAVPAEVDVAVCDFLDAQGSGIVMVKLCR